MPVSVKITRRSKALLKIILASIQVCWEGDNIVSLPDLRTEDSDVLGMWETWITQLVANYSSKFLQALNSTCSFT